jgi:hypothetical protein
MVLRGMQGKVAMVVTSRCDVSYRIHVEMSRVRKGSRPGNGQLIEPPLSQGWVALSSAPPEAPWLE